MVGTLCIETYIVPYTLYVSLHYIAFELVRMAADHKDRPEVLVPFNI